MKREKLLEIIKLSNSMEDMLIAIARDTVTISAKAPSGMPYSNTGSTSDPTADAAMRHADLIDEYIAAYHRMADLINSVEDHKMRTILKLKYVNLLSWKKVAINMKETKDAIYSYYKRNINI